MITRQIFHNPLIGYYALEAQGEWLTKLEFLTNLQIVDYGMSPLLTEANDQLCAYLLGDLRRFDLPFKPVGTDFQMHVWSELLEIPYGQVCSYKGIAIRIGNPRAVRAVGSANNRNPLPIFYPCHRVIGSDGKLVGYGGGLDLKTKLLKLEGCNLVY